MNKLNFKQKHHMNLQHIKGSALMIALFIIVVMTMLGTALVKMQSTSSESIAQEVLGTRALAAARSGMQVELVRLFPPVSDPALPSSCGGNTYTFIGRFSTDAPLGLENCTATVTCDQYASFNEINYYRLESTGQCNAGDINSSNSRYVVESSRTIQVEARSLNE